MTDDSTGAGAASGYPIRGETVTTNGLDFGVLRAGDGDRLALLLHGFPDDANSMRPLLTRLATRGFTAVAPYMRGYGPTASPDDGDFSIGALSRDVLDLAATLGNGETVLVGHDWGAIASYAAARRDSDRFDAVVAMASPPHFWHRMRSNPQQLFRSWYLAFFQLPYVPEAALRADDYELIEHIWSTWSPGWDVPEARLESVKETFRTPGTVEAAVQYYRDLFGSMPDVGPIDADPDPLDIDAPVLVVAGADDGCIGPSMFEGCEDAFRNGASLEVVDGVGHFMHQEAPDRVGDAVVEFVS